jgi:choline dehydrogenase-like flavoprotein
MQRRATSIQHGHLEADVAVIGAGPLGIVVALELARNGHRVILLESGGRRYSGRVQALAHTVGGDEYHAAMELAVRRQIGGTSNLWGGRCVPFDPIDFEAHGPSAPRWAVAYDEIAPYYQRACEWCVCGEAVFDATAIDELADRQLVPGLPNGEVRSSALERWSLPTNFRRVYGTELQRHPCIDLISGLTCTRIACGQDGTSVHHVEARAFVGPTVTVHARYFVVATGGLEATRILFASDDKHRGGIGNHAGLLGRGYMAHVEARVARLSLTTPPDQTIYDHERDPAGVYVRRRFTFARGRQLELGMPNAAIWLVNPEMGDATHGSAVLSFVYLLLRSPLGPRVIAEAIRQAHLESSHATPLGDHIANVIRDLPSAARFALDFGYRRFARRGRKAPGFFVASKANTYNLQYRGEHMPHPESAVEPTPAVDEVGMPRLRTRLYFSPDDVAGPRRALEELDAYVRRHHVGRVEFLYRDVDPAVRQQLRGMGGFHQTGLTRMSEEPEDGVVDRNLAVHGLEDLFVASTSTFPSSGQANPTFTGVAFAVRLADHLHGLLTKEADAPRGRVGRAAGPERIAQ